MTDSPGALCLGQGRCRFVVWAPGRRIELHVLSPRERWIPMEPMDRGYHEAVVDDVLPGTLYRFRVDGGDERPDPASRFQPQGVHGPSQVVSADFPWKDSSWKGRALEDFVIYELHVGTFTPEGTFDAAIPHLDDLRDLGVTAVELMPVAQFPGNRNWGYDGTYPFAVQDSYGGPEGLKRFVDACHARGLAAVLDVVYNHLGPEGNYLWAFAPYFTDRYRTPWGSAVNFDGEGSDEVRRYFIENALMWVREFHVDALRLDAVHAIMDTSARPFLQQLGDEVHAAARDLGRPAYVIAESNRNDPRLVHPEERGGYGLDGLWNDDFHHALHVLLTGEKSGYYAQCQVVKEAKEKPPLMPTGMLPHSSVGERRFVLCLISVPTSAILRSMSENFPLRPCRANLTRDGFPKSSKKRARGPSVSGSSRPISSCG